ncbi:PQQ-binding-like beta-propeller repeat protein [Microlunatus sp. Y2014]|uniref:outer membrane protein assembly factor BamB family protein n=1 Tax=Microlunatus sp. Y2014 TaxID=3418488 RepID=UPI003DA6E4D3
MGQPARYVGIWDQGGIWDDARPSRRRHGGLRTAVAVVLVGSCLLWLTLLGGVTLLPPVLPAVGSSDFTPRDADHVAVTWDPATDTTDPSAEDTPGIATVEQARGRGRSLFEMVSPTFAAEIPLPDRSPGQVHWWRESVLPGGGTPVRQRIRLVEETGISLAGQTWGDLGMVFRPALLELPADVAGGRSWQQDGAVTAPALGDGLTYTLQASAAAGPPDDPDCLVVTYDIVLAGPDVEDIAWQQRSTWCPELGVVDEQGTIGTRSYGFAPTPAGSPVPPSEATAWVDPEPVRAADVADWQSRPITIANGDPVFGTDATPVWTSAPPTVTSTGGLFSANTLTRDIRGSRLHDDGTVTAEWWARPGGAVVTLTGFGENVVTTTSDREVVAYRGGHHRLWTARLSDVVATPPSLLGTDGLVAATVSGEVSAHRLSDGRRLWRTDIGDAIGIAPAAGEGIVAIAGAEGGLTVLEAGDGSERFEVDGYHGRGDGILVAGDTILVWGLGWVDAYDAGDGTRLWGVSDDTVAAVAVLGDTLVVGFDAGTRAFDVRTGRELWTSGPASRVIALANGFALLDPAELRIVDPAGQPVRTFPAPLDLGSGIHEAVLAVAGGKVWVVTNDGVDGIGGTWYGVVSR